LNIPSINTLTVVNIVVSTVDVIVVILISCLSVECIVLVVDSVLVVEILVLNVYLTVHVLLLVTEDLSVGILNIDALLPILTVLDTLLLTVLHTL
jgi:hypothetical protein